MQSTMQSQKQGCLKFYIMYFQSIQETISRKLMKGEETMMKKRSKKRKKEKKLKKFNKENKI